MDRESFLFNFKKISVGDSVEVSGMNYRGSGRVVKTTEEPPHGTPLYPGYLVRLDNGQSVWLTGVSLRKE